MHELHELSITKALAKACKASESSQEATLPIVSTSESLEVMEIHLNWHTPFMMYLRKGACQRIKMNVHDYIIEHDITL
jgi:hypothetical protein